MTGTSSHRDYSAAYRAATEEPERFWAAAVRAAGWIHRPARELDESAPGFGHWYRGGELNACFSALDRHVVAGRADEIALVVDAFGDGEPTAYSYADLLDRVARFAGVLQVLEVGPGDRVLVELPVRVETVIAMLACARIGAVHVLVDGDLSAGELADRLADARPVVTIGPASEPDDDWPRSGPSRLAEAIELSGHRPAQRIVVDRPPGDTDPVAAELDWAVLMRPDTVPPAVCAPVPADHPLYLVYGDGTDGLTPVTVATGGYVTGLSAAMREVYGLGPGDVLVSTAALASREGHQAGVYGPLLAGATTVLVDGAPSGDEDAVDLPGVLARHRVDAVFTTPDGLGRLPELPTRIRAVFLVGGDLNPDAGDAGPEGPGRPVVDDYAGDLVGPFSDQAIRELPERTDPGTAADLGNPHPRTGSGRSDVGWRRD